MTIYASAITAQIDHAGEESGASTSRSELIEHLRSLAVKFLVQRLSCFHDESERFLFELAGNTQDEDLHTLYLDTISRLRNKREHIKRVTIERFHQLIKVPEADAMPFTATSAKIDGLLLTGDDDLESTLAIKRLISQACERYIAHLDAVEDIHTRLWGNSIPNPLSPTLFCVAWKEAVDELDAPLGTNAIAYKLFTKFVINHLGTLYDRALSELSTKGISARGQSAKTAVPAVTTPITTPSQKSEHDPEALTRELVMKRGIEILKSASTEQGLDGRDRAIVDTLTFLQGYLDVLQPVSGNHRPGRGGGDMCYLFSRLMQLAYADGFRTHHGAMLDAVAGVIDPLLNNDGIDSRARVLLARLQVPVLKVAVLDPAFVDDPHHPLQILLQRISSLTQFNEDPKSDFTKARQLVSRVVSELKNDVGVLGSIVLGPGPISKPSSTAQVPVNVAAESAAAASVRGQIEKCIRGRRIPDAVRSFIDTTWSEVIKKLAATDGPNSESCLAALKTVNDLVTVVQPYDYAAHHETVMETIPGLLCRLQNGLSSIAADRGLKDQIFNRLIAVHARSIHFKKLNTKLTSLKTTK